MTKPEGFCPHDINTYIEQTDGRDLSLFLSIYGCRKKTQCLKQKKGSESSGTVIPDSAASTIMESVLYCL